MANNPGVSEVQDKDGVIADIEAKRFDGTRTVQMQGDVTASQTWNGDSSTPLTLNASIGAKKVTQDKIGDKAVGSGQMADGSVGLTQIAASAMTDSVSANNSKLVTSQGVNAAIAAATLNRGKDYGPMSVDEINAIAETIPTGSTVYVEHLGAGDAKVINDGYSDGTMASFSVEVGEDLKYYRAPDNSLHGWHSTEANVKIKQPANYAGGIAVDSAQDASSGSAGIEFIQSFKQDTNGNIRDIVKAQVDIVDSTSSTRTNAAATPNSVKSAYDLANTANTGLANKLDKTGDGKDVTVSFSEASTRANIGTGEKLSVMFGKIKKWFTDLGTAAFKNVPASGDASSTEVVLGSDTRLSAGASAVQDVTVGGTSVVDASTKEAALGTAAGKDVPASGNASTTQVVMGDDSRLEAITLNNANDLNDCVGVHGGVLLYKWAASSMPNNAPINGTSIMEVVRTHSTDNYVTQTVYVANKSNVYRREYLRVNSVWTWTDWYEYAKSATTLAGYGITDAYTKTEVNSALASKVTGPSSATADDIAVFDGATGKTVKDGGKKLSDLKTKQTAVSDPTASGTALSFIDSFTQNANGEASVTKKSVTVDSTPTAGSSNPVSSGGVKDSLDAISTAAGAEAEVTAAALDDLDERMQSVEDAVNSDNIGDKIADSFDAQVLKMGGENLADLLGGKVDKEAGKGLSTNDFTDAYKSNVDTNTQARHSHSNKTVLDGISSSDIDNWNAKQAALEFMTDTDVNNLFTAAWDAANS